jgi:hypothetical protein
MPDPRGLYFGIIERHERRPWLEADEKPLYRTTDAEPLPTETGHRRSSHLRRLAIRLRMIVGPVRRAHGALR